MVKKDIPNVSPKKMARIIEDYISSNKKAEADGLVPLAVCFQGEAGVGKTSIPKQVAKKLNMGHHRLNLSQIEDIGDLVGFPYKSFEMTHAKTITVEGTGTATPITKVEVISEWFNENLCRIKEVQGWEYTGEAVTRYAPPEWLLNLNNPNGSLLVIDDFTRGDMRFQQAIMQLIQDGSYYSWKLPAGYTIILTANPNDGDYMVNEQDLAMSGRYCTFNVIFDIESWVDWATVSKVDGRCMNIMIKEYEELMYSTDSERRAKNKFDVSPRDWTMFFQLIRDIPDLSAPDALRKLDLYGNAYVGGKIDIFLTSLTQKLDSLPSPEDILEKDFSYIKRVLHECCGTVKDLKDGSFTTEKNPYRAEIASLISMRLQYYISNHLKNNPLSKEMEERLSLIFDNDFFSSETKLAMVNHLHQHHAAKVTKILSRPEFVENVLRVFEDV